MFLKQNLKRSNQKKTQKEMVGGSKRSSHEEESRLENYESKWIHPGLKNMERNLEKIKTGSTPNNPSGR